MKNFGYHFLLLLSLLVGCSQAEDRPNIIYIMADDLGYAELGSYGQKLIRTPNLDEMASEGMRFTSVYSGSQVCAPCRSVLMTGLHTGHTRVRQNSGLTGGVPDEMSGGGHRIPLEDEDHPSGPWRNDTSTM